MYYFQAQKEEAAGRAMAARQFWIILAQPVGAIHWQHEDLGSFLLKKADFKKLIYKRGLNFSAHQKTVDILGFPGFKA